MFYQNSIIKKYLALLNDEQVMTAWQTYKTLFFSEKRQRNILTSKEEQYQEGFLRELFVAVLGYTIHPDADYNLITEKKNETNSKKADGAIQRDGRIIGVIELKDHKTPNLTQVEAQAFGYKNQHKGTRYVIISNFEKLRFYIDDATEYREWDLFTLTQEDFRELYFCLSWDTLSQDLPYKAKTESVSNEDRITRQLYHDYSAFKRELFADILKRNTTDDSSPAEALRLFKKTQKLLDRLLFIFFAEDCNLLPPNMMSQIINEWEQLKALDVEIPLYTRIRQYFGYLDAGNDKKNIYAYNGGLFKPDEELDALTVSDELLARHTKKLSEYDYASEVDVNILGHIFENSLSEIEEVTAQINASSLIPDSNSGLTSNSTAVSKRKRDGVFYTPQYITKYIVENTVGRLCAEKKAELGILNTPALGDECVPVAQSAPKGTRPSPVAADLLGARPSPVAADLLGTRSSSPATKKRDLDRLDQYRSWLLDLKICDPACGSGAFLNAALLFLMAEHRLIDEMQAQITGDSIVFQNVENSILENNLYGVDINEESVEIAKLALWLRTAKPQRKLSSLNNNIKCGNSLISDPAIAGDKAFDWQREFPQVFDKGGFDVIIGNPPYVNMVNILDEKQRKYYQQNYKTVKNKSDLYSIFTEKASHLLKPKGLFGFIFSNSWMGTESFSAFREFLAHDVKVTKLVQLPAGVFEDATVTTALCFYTNKKPTEQDNIIIETCINKEFVSKGFTLPYKQVLANPNTSFSFEKTIELNKVPTIELGKIASFSLGIKTSDDVRFVFDEKKDDDCYLFLRGRNIKRWNTPQNNEWLWYKPELICEKPGGRPRIFENFVVEKKIVIQDMAMEINATLDFNKYLCNDKVNIIFETDSNYSMEYILTLLNSKLVNKWFKKIYTSGLEIKINQLRTIPIPTIPLESQQPFIDLADRMLALNKELQEKRGRFLRRLQDNLGRGCLVRDNNTVGSNTAGGTPASQAVRITTALETFDTLDFAGFVAELKKQKISLSLVQQDEWEDYFNQYKAACNELTTRIAETDKEIDRRVYALYALTDEEIKRIEQ